ncbi:hypothetical protein ACFQZ4_02700 [Catellatospora coxensis]
MRRVRPRSELERAAPGGRLLLEYQPMVRLADSAAVGFDALTRCNHPARGGSGLRSSSTSPRNPTPSHDLYLRRILLDVVKLDRAFTSTLTTSTRRMR